MEEIAAAVLTRGDRAATIADRLSHIAGNTSSPLAALLPWGWQRSQEAARLLDTSQRNCFIFMIYGLRIETRYQCLHT
jgi:hypothetical protein